MVLNNHKIVIHINRQEDNLPIIYNSYVNSAKNKRHGPLLILGMAFIGLYSLDFFGYIITDTDSSVKEGEVMLTHKIENRFCGPCIGSRKNQNVTDTQN